jgi:hypothetical protein
MEHEQETTFQLSGEDEQIIRTYECTKLRRFLSPATVGYLTITNKRVVFHSSGKSLTGKSFLINEMPIEDATGISAYLGVSINWFLFLVFGIALYFATQFLVSVFPRFFTSWIFGILLMVPYLVLWLLSGSTFSEETRNRILQSVDDILPKKIEADTIITNNLDITRIIFYIGLAIVGWDIASRIPLLTLVLLAVVYFFIYIYMFRRYKTFSLVIGSKTMKDTGIYIPGESFRILSSRETTALDAMSANPAVDAERVTRELGALLLDIRQLGDLGVEKWKQLSN